MKNIFMPYNSHSTEYGQLYHEQSNSIGIVNKGQQNKK